MAGIKYFEVSDDVENKVPVVVSLTNFANFLGDSDRDKKIFEYFWPGEVPMVRPRQEMAKIKLNNLATGLKGPPRKKYESYHTATVKLIEQRRRQCASSNMVFLDLNIIKGNGHTKVLIDGADTCHPLIIGELLLQFQILGLPVECKKIGTKKALTKKIRSANEKNHVVSLGISEDSIDQGYIYGAGINQNLKNLIFGAIVGMTESTNKLNKVK